MRRVNIRAPLVCWSCFLERNYNYKSSDRPQANNVNSEQLPQRDHPAQSSNWITTTSNLTARNSRRVVSAAQTCCSPSTAVYLRAYSRHVIIIIIIILVERRRLVWGLAKNASLFGALGDTFASETSNNSIRFHSIQLGEFYSIQPIKLLRLIGTFPSAGKPKTRPSSSSSNNNNRREE